MKDKKMSDNKIFHLPICMCLGISFGTLIGIATNNLSVFLPVGVSIGLCIGSLIDFQNDKKNKDGNKKKERTE